MKKILYWAFGYQLAALFIIPFVVFAAEVSVEWDANIPTPDGYRVFVREVPNAFNYSVPAWEGIATTCTIENLENGKTYAFVVRAYTGKAESGDSNEVIYTPEDTITITIPTRPKNIMINFE